jgi:multidrug resistance efflux pump
VDQDRFKLALRQAQATVADRKETLAQAQRESRRNRGLGNLVASEQLEESQSREARAQAALAEAQVTVDSAQLNLDRSVIRSPVDGYVNDRAPRVRSSSPPGARCCRWWTAIPSTSTAI